jgi:predicted metal-dependent enzyme (double-stranded beta helix superfamily)
MDEKISARQAVIEATMNDVRTIEADLGVTREGVAAMRDRLLEMASHRELFSLDDYEPAESGSAMYRIAQDADDRFALYVNASDGERSTPAHNHTTWAVVVGFEGQELNKFYERAESGAPPKTHEHMVEAGTGVAMLPDDLHSIHLSGRALNFHMYGLALEKLDKREYYSETDDVWKFFPGINGIVEGRPHLASC